MTEQEKELRAAKHEGIRNALVTHCTFNGKGGYSYNVTEWDEAANPIAVHALYADYDALLAEVEALRKDKERLDFMCKTESFVEQEKGMWRVYRDVAMAADPRHKWQAYVTHWSPTAREAIDSALQSQGSQR